MKVLVAYDGLLDSKEALKYGFLRVREFTGELIALHVFPSHRYVDYNVGRRAEERARRDAFHHLDEAWEFICSNGRDGIKASLVFTEGHARKEILSYATKKDVDLIVVPSSLDSLVDAACCPVDVVSADEEADAVISAILNSPGVPVESLQKWPNTSAVTGYERCGIIPKRSKNSFFIPRTGEIENPLHGESWSEGDHTQIEQRHSHARMQHVHDNVDEQATVPVQIEDK